MCTEKPKITIPENDVQTTGTSPDNPVDKAADFLPRALIAIKQYFKEAVFLLFILGYIFIAAFGHMEKIQNYIGYLIVILIGILVYKIWDKITIKDFIYIFLVLILVTYILWLKFGHSIINWL